MIVEADLDVVLLHQRLEGIDRIDRLGIDDAQAHGLGKLENLARAGLVLRDADHAVRDGDEVVLLQLGLHLFDHLGRGVVVPLHVRLLGRELLAGVELDDFAADRLGLLDRLEDAVAIERVSLAADGEAAGFGGIREVGSAARRDGETASAAKKRERVRERIIRRAKGVARERSSGARGGGGARKFLLRARRGDQSRRNMRIRSVETFLVPPRWCFVKITTEDGLAGWGEPVVEGKAATVAAAVEEMTDFLIGRDAGRIEDLWQVLYRGGFYRGGPVLMSAISGIDQALWDIKGKALGVPVYELLGGAVREKIRVYAWIGGDRPSDVAAAAKAKQEQGYTAIKMNGTEETEWIGSPARLREAVAARVGDPRGVRAGLWDRDRLSRPGAQGHGETAHARAGGGAAALYRGAGPAGE